MFTIAALRAVKFVLLLPKKLEHPLEAPTFAKVHRRTRKAVFDTGVGSMAGIKLKKTPTESVEWAVDESDVQNYGGVPCYEHSSSR
ncbi:hypothetical protein F444_09179 [Phytophthora nicotianae P1976]|uniref:Uncharacterized protein n=1 Tax=Phytophthora nicotianae P1976 TaxID=1317066 RepID=A0A081A8I2_PHYNI|nr:hypothetical protein F444_09179 [Phytophthora nicotianae P1976]